MDSTEARSLKMLLNKLDRKLDAVLKKLEEHREPNKAYTVREASYFLGISERQVTRLVNEGKVSSLKVGGRRLIPSESLVRYQVAHGLA